MAIGIGDRGNDRAMRFLNRIEESERFSDLVRYRIRIPLILQEHLIAYGRSVGDVTFKMIDRGRCGGWRRRSRCRRWGRRGGQELITGNAKEIGIEDRQ